MGEGNVRPEIRKPLFLSLSLSATFTRDMLLKVCTGVREGKRVRVESTIMLELFIIYAFGAGLRVYTLFVREEQLLCDLSSRIYRLYERKFERRCGIVRASRAIDSNFELIAGAELRHIHRSKVPSRRGVVAGTISWLMDN